MPAPGANKVFLLLIFFLQGSHVKSQRVAAYFDYKNYFVVFDDGSYKELEYTPVSSYRIGGDFVAYINMDSSLKFYYKGDVSVLEESKPQSFACSENLLIYKMNRRLMKVEEGNNTMLCEWASDYAVGDSIAAFTDYGDPGFKVYYNGETKALETGTSQGGVKQYRVSPNLVAYIDANNNLKIFWHGKTYDTKMKSFSLSFEVATDMVAFVDNFSNEFKVFYKGDVITLDQTPPQSYKVSLNSVAYVDAAGNFNIFYNGETIFVSGHAPDAYIASGNIISFSMNNQWKVFFKGKMYVLESTKLDWSNLNLKNLDWDTKLARNTLTYLDPMGRMKIFDNGEVKSNISYELPVKLRDINDIIVYTIGINTVNVYYKGKVY